VGEIRKGEWREGGREGGLTFLSSLEVRRISISSSWPYSRALLLLLLAGGEGGREGGREGCEIVKTKEDGNTIEGGRERVREEGMARTEHEQLLCLRLLDEEHNGKDKSRNAVEDQKPSERHEDRGVVEHGWREGREGGREGGRVSLKRWSLESQGRRKKKE